jgi:DNA-binding LacI/PurR family transcriptional regulator
MTQSQLAERAALGLSTVVDFEKERRQVSEESVKRIRDALEEAGIEFISQNGEKVGLLAGRPRPRRK